jgi:FG-GAP repeat
MKTVIRRLTLAHAIRVGLLSGVMAGGAAQAQFPAVMPLSGLNGQNGFRIDGVAADDKSGFFVSSAGDINGDGIDDVIVGAFRADPGGRIDAGAAYVVFGRASSLGFAASEALSSLNGNNGFRIEGVAADDRTGVSVASAGDVNDDGVADLIIGAHSADPGGRSYAGSSFVLFGRTGAGFPPSIELSALDGSNGFRVNGVGVDDRSGLVVASAGDINGDGVADLVIGADRADPSGLADAGSSYVVFGRTKAQGFAPTIELSDLNGSNGFRLDGQQAGDQSGRCVAAAGDINGDGIDDLVVGAHYAPPSSGVGDSGRSYVVFGKPGGAGFASVVELGALDGSNGFRLVGISPFDLSGKSVAAAGDINGDGMDDLVIGAFRADTYAGDSAGETYVVFGKSFGDGFVSSIELSNLNGSDGFRLDGSAPEARSGSSVAAAGDVNGDGLDDLIIGAYRAQGGDGRSYVMFGYSGGLGNFSALSLSALNGRYGFRLDGVGAASNDFSGRSVAAAGDINGDGIDDLIVGADLADANGQVDAGSSYVVFGTASIFGNGFESP